MDFGRGFSAMHCLLDIVYCAKPITVVVKNQDICWVLEVTFGLSFRDAI